MQSRPRLRAALRCLHGWVEQFIDIRRALSAGRNLPGYIGDLRRYRKLSPTELVRFRDLQPQLHDRTAHTPFDPHYLYLNAWAARRVASQNAPRHVDVGSQLVFPAMLSSTSHVIYLDYRPAQLHLPRLTSLAADALHLPFVDSSVPSLSCLHVAEHIGLGRYGDPLDPGGTRKAAAELARVLAPGGHLYFAVPVGKSRVQFNAHRVQSPREIVAMFPTLELRMFSAVDDLGHYREEVQIEDHADSTYACGMFWFHKPTNRSP